MNSRSRENIRRPHPLARALVDRLRGNRPRVLEIGAGSGRNTAALRAAGFDVCAIPDAQTPQIDVPLNGFDAALSTHAFLHGTRAIVQTMIRRTARALKPNAVFYCTFASKRDARYGSGTRVERDTYAPQSGEEAGVPHVYFEREELLSLLHPEFAVESLTEQDVEAIVGSWAHPTGSPGAVHWFVQARRNA